MSYRDLRNFSESMRSLGYPQAVSLESFRTPNWPQLAQCVRWLAARVEPDTSLPTHHDTVEQRVQLIAQAVALFHSRANLKLSGPRLYGADGWAVRELLKVTGLLRAAIAAPRAEPAGARGDKHLSYDVSNRLSEIRQARSLATELTAQGAFLYDLLAKETDNKEIRELAVSRSLDLSAMESTVHRALNALRSRAAAERERREAAVAGSMAIDDKLQRRRQELQRAEKRLHTVQKIRPAYQGELTALESEVAILWEQYVLRYRILEALKHQLSMLESKHHEALEEQQAAILQLIHKYEAEDVLGKLSESDDDSSDEAIEANEPRPRPSSRPNTRLRIKTAGIGGLSNRAPAGVGVASTDAKDSMDDSSDSGDSDLPYGNPPVEQPRARPRPITRTLIADDDEDFSELIRGTEGDGADSLGSSSESELRLSDGPPARPRTSGRTGNTRLSQPSDDEF